MFAGGVSESPTARRSTVSGSAARDMADRPPAVLPPFAHVTRGQTPPLLPTRTHSESTGNLNTVDAYASADALTSPISMDKLLGVRPATPGAVAPSDIDSRQQAALPAGNDSQLSRTKSPFSRPQAPLPAGGQASAAHARGPTPTQGFIDSRPPAQLPQSPPVDKPVTSVLDQRLAMQSAAAAGLGKSIPRFQSPASSSNSSQQLEDSGQGYARARNDDASNVGLAADLNSSGGHYAYARFDGPPPGDKARALVSMMC